MTCKQLIEYLKEFNSDEVISVVIGDPKRREHYNIECFNLLAGGGNPAFIITVDGYDSLDETEAGQ